MIENIYIQAQGTRWHYQVTGPAEAPPLVLLHGIGGSVNWWENNLPEFQNHFRTYALALPGFGKSWRLSQPYTIERLAVYLRDWLGLVGLEKVFLLGHSMGGQVAARFAALHPERVEKLILAAPSGLWPTVAERLRWFRDVPDVKVPFRQTLTIACGTFKTDLITLVLCLNALYRDGLQSTYTLQNLSKPTLVLWGTADSVLPPLLGKRVVSQIIRAKGNLKLIDLGTHDMMFDQAAAFNKVVLEFLR